MQIKYCLYLLIIIGTSCSQQDSINSKENVEKKYIEARKERAKYFEETLIKRVGLQNFEELVSEKKDQDVEILRLIKSVFAFGINNIILIEVRTQNNLSKLVSYDLEFDRECIDIYHYSSDCFKITETKEITLSEQVSNQLNELISQTELINTRYFARGKVLCDGANYLIKYAHPSKLREEIFTIDRSCPSIKTAVSLVGEELISIKRLY